MEIQTEGSAAHPGGACLVRGAAAAGEPVSRATAGGGGRGEKHPHHVAAAASDATSAGGRPATGNRWSARNGRSTASGSVAATGDGNHAAGTDDRSGPSSGRPACPHRLVRTVGGVRSPLRGRTGPTSARHRHAGGENARTLQAARIKLQVEERLAQHRQRRPDTGLGRTRAEQTSLRRHDGGPAVEIIGTGPECVRLTGVGRRIPIPV